MLSLSGTGLSDTRPTIAFNAIGGLEWVCGVLLIRNLLQAVRSRYGNEIALCPLGYSSDAERLNGFKDIADDLLVYPEVRRGTPLWVVNGVLRRLFGRDMVRDSYLKRKGVKVVAYAGLRGQSKIPTLSIIYDFQHVHFPEHFSAWERAELDRRFGEMARLSSRVLLISEFVKRDFQRIFPAHAHKARVLAPVSVIPPSVYQDRDQLEAVCALYHLPGKFVYLPNQFWKQKNHDVVFRALQALRERGQKVFLVSSGYPGDYRHPAHFADLLQKLSLYGLRDQVALLGLVPREHVFALIRQSVCVLNASVHEGFGMSVDEARSLGKQVVVSDIPPHREQDPPGAVFFDPRDPADLAGKLEAVWLAKPGGPDDDREREARASLPARIRGYAESFMAVVQEVAGGDLVRNGTAPAAGG